MKRVLASICAAALALSLAACSSTASSSESSSAAEESSSAASTTEESSAASDESTGASGSITVVTREDGSGTRSAFIELTGVETDEGDMTIATAQVANSTNNVMTSVQAEPSAIGYISMGSLNETVKGIAVDGVEPTTDNVKAGTYPISRPFNIVTNGDISAQDELTQDFVNWVMSADGQAICTEEGYIGDDAAEAYTSTQPSGSLAVGGSSSVSPVMEKLIETYMADVNPNASIDLQTTDSTNGVTGALDGTYNIGMASRAISDDEASQGAVSTQLAMDCIAVIVNTENAVSNISMDSLRGIYTGEVTDWADVQ